jgi:hypothetical protein
MPMPRTPDIPCRCTVPAAGAPAGWCATPPWPTAAPAWGAGVEGGR